MAQGAMMMRKPSEYVSQTVRGVLELPSNDVGGHSTAAMRPHGLGCGLFQVLSRFRLLKRKARAVDREASDKDKLARADLVAI